MKDFLDFIKEQGIVGLAVGFILGGSVSQVVSSLVNDIINPFIGIFLGPTKDLGKYSYTILGATFQFGHFMSITLNFVIVAIVVYVVVRKLGLDQKLDKKK